MEEFFASPCTKKLLMVIAVRGGVCFFLNQKQVANRLVPSVPYIEQTSTPFKYFGIVYVVRAGLYISEGHYQASAFVWRSVGPRISRISAIAVSLGLFSWQVSIFLRLKSFDGGIEPL